LFLFVIWNLRFPVIMGSRMLGREGSSLFEIAQIDKYFMLYPK